MKTPTTSQLSATIALAGVVVAVLAWIFPKENNAMENRTLEANRGELGPSIERPEGDQISLKKYDEATVRVQSAGMDITINGTEHESPYVGGAIKGIGSVALIDLPIGQKLTVILNSAGTNIFLGKKISKFVTIADNGFDFELTEK